MDPVLAALLTVGILMVVTGSIALLIYVCSGYTVNKIKEWSWLTAEEANKVASQWKEKPLSLETKEFLMTQIKEASNNGDLVVVVNKHHTQLISEDDKKIKEWLTSLGYAYREEYWEAPCSSALIFISWEVVGGQ